MLIVPNDTFPIDNATKAGVRLRISVVALFVDEREVLLIHQMTPPEPDCWDLPGGGLEPHEPLLDGLRREVKEETGLTDFHIENLLTVTELFMPKDNDQLLHAINIVYQCTVPNRLQPLFSHDPEVGRKGIQWLPVQSLSREQCSSRCWNALMTAHLIQA